ncbi:7841_t:CDS:2 [Acaulospora colombiana]|uniref:7841_t:CDS:1 n=1 Tax=Acaulospora colombiana TaxID=27376 RepID=A0ACA9NTR9_9GLOM|nr:7841_t:CDS:2 [Acaulospora colombiana]
MSSLPCATKSDINNLQGIVSRFSSHPNQLLYKGKPLVSTFAGEACTYGGGLAAFWAEFKSSLNGNVHFVPSLFVDPGQLGTLSFLDGAFNAMEWWVADSVECGLLSTPNRAGDKLVDYRPFIFPWSCRQDIYCSRISLVLYGMRHYGPDTWNKNWIYRADDWLYARRWEDLVQMRDQVDIVEIITWNEIDYGESHYIGPITGAQPNSQAWVDGFDHQGWLELSTYYIEAFKTGIYPSITQDKVFLWARPHPRDATAPDHVPRPNNAQLTDDFFWAIVFAKEPCTAILYTPSPTTDPGAQPPEINYKEAMVTDVPSGVNKLRFPLQPTKTMAIRLEREGNTVLDYVAEGYFFNPSPQVYNFNAWVGWKSGQ